MPGKQQHFRPEEWVDFVSGTASLEQAQTLRNHLQQGCGACAKTLQLWTRVCEAAKRDASYQVPRSAVQNVQSAFSLMAAERKPARRFEIPRLVFDSLWQPAFAGVRSATPGGPRQVLYKTDSVTIELRIEPEPLSERFHIAGQVHTVGQASQPVAGIVVLASSKNGVLAESRTNTFGEFQLSFVPEAGLQISFVIPQNREVTIPLEARGNSLLDQN